MCLPGIGGWTPAQRAGLVQIIRAKGGSSEIDYVRRFDGHLALRRTLRRLVSRTRE
jgi:hypothetical protein